MGRQKDVDFSHTLFTTGVRFLARQAVLIDGVPSLWRRRIAVSNGTTAQETMARVQREQELQVVVVATDAEGVRLVEEGKVDAFAQDDILLYALLAASPKKDSLHVTGRHLTVEPYAFMLPKDDVPLREVVDRTVLALMHSGELAGPVPQVVRHRCAAHPHERPHARKHPLPQQVRHSLSARRHCRSGLFSVPSSQSFS